MPARRTVKMVRIWMSDVKSNRPIQMVRRSKVDWFMPHHRNGDIVRLWATFSLVYLCQPLAAFSMFLLRVNSPLVCVCADVCVLVGWYGLIWKPHDHRSSIEMRHELAGKRCMAWDELYAIWMENETSNSERMGNKQRCTAETVNHVPDNAVEN